MLIDSGTGGVEGLLQGLELGLHRVEVVLLDRLLELGGRGLDLGLVLSADLVAQLAQLLLGLIDQGFGLVLHVDPLALLLVSAGVGFGVLHHLLHLVVTEGGSTGDGDALLLTAALVLGGDAQDAVGVDVEGDFDLGNATGGRGDAIEAEGSERLVVAGHLALALEHVDFHVGLTVHGGGVGLRLLGRDGGVPGDHLGHHTAQGFHTQGEGSDVQQKDVLDLTGEHTALNGGAHGHHLVGVHGLVGGLPGDALHQLEHGGDAGGTTHHHHFVQLGGGQLGVLQGLLDGHAAAVDQLGGQLFELGPGQGQVEVLGAFRGGRDERQVDLALGRAGELDLGLLSRFGQTLQGLLVAAQVDAFVGLEGVGQVINDHLVEVVTTQVGITGGGEHLEDTVAHLEDGHVEGAAAQVEDQDFLVALLVQAVGQGRRGGLVDDAQHLEASDLAGVLGGLALGVVEVGGNGDHRLGHGLAEVLAGVFGQLAQHLSADFLRGELLVEDRALDLDVGAGLLDAVAHFLGLFVHLVHPASDETLDGIEGVLRVHHRLALGDLTHQLILVLGVCHHGGRGAEALSIGDHGGLAALHDRHAAVGGAKVDTDNLAHG